MRYDIMFEKYITNGIAYLLEQQQKDGSFLSFSSPSQIRFESTLTYHTTFSTSLILLSLNALTTNPQLERIKRNAANFLLTQKSAFWSWNYWARNSEEAKTMPYPDDLDATFYALAALFQNDVQHIDGAIMSKIVNILLATETEEGGPYQTWLVSKDADTIWHDIDIAVNSNIAYFLFLNDIELSKLTEFIESHIQNNTVTSPYYPSSYPIIYFISRFYRGNKTKILEQKLLEEKSVKDQWNNPLQTALAVSSLLNLGLPPIKLKQSIEYLMSSQQKGIWKPYAFCLDPAKNGKTYYAGSSALTTAFCLEAMAKYERALHSQKTIIQVEKKNTESEKIYHLIVTIVKKRFSVFDTKMNKISLTLLNEILGSDTQKQISLLPYYFSQALEDTKKNINDDFIIKLGIANVMGWIAYTIYDDFLDNEGEPKMLSCANLALRELTKLFETLLLEQSHFVPFFHMLMDQLDSANMWEVSHCRVKTTSGKLEMKGFILPDFKNHEQLAQKSLGHALGPIAILFSLGYTEDSPQIKSLLSFFKHYLIARQLNDDAHDWEKDLEKGQINAIGCLLLQKIYQKELANKETVSLKKLIPKLQKIFWHTTIHTVSSLVYEHTDKARKALKKCSVVTDQSFSEHMLVRYENAVTKAVEESKNAIEFLRAY